MVEDVNKKMSPEKKCFKIRQLYKTGYRAGIKFWDSEKFKAKNWVHPFNMLKSMNTTPAQWSRSNDKCALMHIMIFLLEKYDDRW